MSPMTSLSLNYGSVLVFMPLPLCCTNPSPSFSLSALLAPWVSLFPALPPPGSPHWPLVFSSFPTFPLPTFYLPLSPSSKPSLWLRSSEPTLLPQQCLQPKLFPGPRALSASYFIWSFHRNNSHSLRVKSKTEHILCSPTCPSSRTSLFCSLLPLCTIAQIRNVEINLDSSLSLTLHI